MKISKGTQYTAFFIIAFAETQKFSLDNIHICFCPFFSVNISENMFPIKVTILFRVLKKSRHQG